MENEEYKTYSGENKKLFRFFEKILIRRDDDKPYLYRNTLFSFYTWLSIKLHRIVASDDECLHDHPWPFITFIYSGGYYEWTFANMTPGQCVAAHLDGKILDWHHSPDGKLIVKKWYGPGSLLYRPAAYAHRLELKQERRRGVIDGLLTEGLFPVECKTFVITFAIIRKWGFFSKFGWLWHNDYKKKDHC